MSNYTNSAMALVFGLIGLLITLVIIAFSSCEKAETTYNGTYYGPIEYHLSGIKQETTARRIITDNGEGSVKIHWWDAPPVDCYTVITEGSYPINNVEILSEPYCNGVKQKDMLVFCGRGTFIGDSLVEKGIVYHYTNIGSSFENTESGTWIAKFKKQ